MNIAAAADHKTKVSHSQRLIYMLILIGSLSACAIPQQRNDLSNDYPPQPFLSNIGYCSSCYPDTPPQPIAVMPSFTLESLYFKTNQAILRSTAHAKLDSIIAAIQLKHPQIILIEGHADSRAGENYNQSLSERRANAVRDALIAGGIQAARITSRGYGEQRPIATNHDRLGRQRNRRVEIYLQ